MYSLTFWDEVQKIIKTVYSRCFIMNLKSLLSKYYWCGKVPKNCWIATLYLSVVSTFLSELECVNVGTSFKQDKAYRPMVHWLSSQSFDWDSLCHIFWHWTHTGIPKLMQRQLFGVLCITNLISWHSKIKKTRVCDQKCEWKDRENDFTF